MVIDTSYVIACTMPDEERPRTMAAVLNEVLTVPFIWPLEVASAIQGALRRRRVSKAAAAGVARVISQLEARVVPPWHDDVERYFLFAQTHDLTPYDAIYIDLCLAEHADLASRDTALLRAAARVGIRTHS